MPFFYNIRLVAVPVVQWSRADRTSLRVKMKIKYIILLLAVYAANGQRVRRQGFIDLKADRCTNPKGEPGICMSIRKCPTLVNLLVTQRQQVEVANFLRQSVCGFEGGDPRVCCPAAAVDTTTTQPATIKPKSTISSTANPIQDNPSRGSAALPEKCGINVAQAIRVVGGTNASLGAWPWMAALGYQSTRGGSKPTFLCAGSLITSKHILTAAHCLPKNKKLIVARLGVVDLYDENNSVRPVDAGIARIAVHENYNPSAFTNDIAVVELDKPVPFSKYIFPVCLPISREIRSKNLVARRPFLAGWGSTSFGGPSSATLVQLQVPVVAESVCKRAFESFKTAVVDKRVLCAGYLTGGKDACRGDSGGPLMDHNTDDALFYQIGVVSYGYKCAEPGFPGVYTRVTEYVDWILNKLG